MEDLLFYSQSMDLIVSNIFKPNKMNSIQNVTVNYPTLTLVIKNIYITHTNLSILYLYNIFYKADPSFPSGGLPSAFWSEPHNNHIFTCYF